MRTGYLVAIILSGALGYYISLLVYSVQPNYRWVRLYNNSNCDVKAVNILFQNRTVTTTAEQIDKTTHPYTVSESDINIPILASIETEYSIGLKFNDCPDRLGSKQKIKSGSIIEVWIEKDDINYGAR